MLSVNFLFWMHNFKTCNRQLQSEMKFSDNIPMVREKQKLLHIYIKSAGNVMLRRSEREISEPGLLCPHLHKHHSERSKSISSSSPDMD